MSEEVTHEVVDSLAKIGKQWHLGESVGRVWGFLLFTSSPVTQREIAEGTGYSRGLISRCLQLLEMTGRVEACRVGQEKQYSVKTTLTESFGEMMKRFSSEIIDPTIALLSENMDKIGEERIRENFSALLHEYKKLYLAVHIFTGIIEDINIPVIAADMDDTRDYVVVVDIEDRTEYEAKAYDRKGGPENGAV